MFKNKINIRLLYGVICFIIVFIVLQNTGISAQSDIDTDNTSPNWTSIMPSLVAIIMALITRHVIFSLFFGIWIGTWLVTSGDITGIFSSFFHTMNLYMVPAVADINHASIIIFTLLIGSMVGIVTANGGMYGIVNRLSRYVRSRKSGQVLTALMGGIIFFDDYANSMVVGNTMRPITDKLKISREKLAYLVDSTAAPISTLALISTWIGGMVSYIASSQEPILNEGVSMEQPYTMFLYSLPFNFYAIFAIACVFIVALTRRDWGAMRKAEEKAYREMDNENANDMEDNHLTDEYTPTYTEPSWTWLRAIIPILTLTFGTIAGLFVTGEGDTIQDIIASSDSYASLVWGSLLAIVAAFVMSLIQKKLSIEKTTQAFVKGMTQMFNGILILVFAWALSKVTGDLGTASYVISQLEGVLLLEWLPLLTFLLAGIIAFSTGTSWGTMGIMMPIVLPLAWYTATEQSLPEESINFILYGTISAVLAGAVWGDHCSPISDTTILSSLACKCNHIKHVKTQLPYSLFVAIISCMAYIGYAMLNLSVWIIYCIGILLLIGGFLKFGKKLDPIKL